MAAVSPVVRVVLDMALPSLLFPMMGSVFPNRDRLETVIINSRYRAQHYQSDCLIGEKGISVTAVNALLPAYSYFKILAERKLTAWT